VFKDHGEKIITFWKLQMTTYILTIGFIPNDWTGDTDGTTQVFVGVPDFSQTVEYDYEIDDDFIKNITTGKVIKAGRNDDPFEDISKESAKLSNGQGVLSDSILSNIYELCLDETEEVDPQVDLFEDGLVFFLNENNKYNGCFYCRYLVVDEGEIETEKLFVVNKQVFTDEELDDDAFDDLDDEHQNEINIKNNENNIGIGNRLTFKLVVSDDEKITYTANLSYEAVSSLVSDYADNSDNNDFFMLAAKHPASTVREQVACKDNINAEVIDTLQNDSSIAVLRNLVNSSAFKSNTTMEYLEKIIPLDAEIAQTVANNIEAFEKVNITKLATLLASNPDPSVLASLAGNYNTPKKILKMLINHEDLYVASEAKSTFEN
jgi:hypothetical protein